MIYKHTQIGYLIFGILVFVAILFIALLIKTSFNIYIVLLFPFLTFILYSFSSLTVELDESEMKVKFGWGIYKTNFQIDEISSISIVKNKWYYGYGIRIWFWPKMVIYNVSGFDAVELALEDGSIYRVGTDEPEILYNALQYAMHE